MQQVSCSAIRIASASDANWYDTATLDLLEASPVNCLLVTWSAGSDAELERAQQRLVKLRG